MNEQALINGLNKVLKNKKQGQAKRVLVYLDKHDMVRLVDKKFPEYQSRLTEEANDEIRRKAGFSGYERLIIEE
ncbi:hypothetical protein LCGC14_2776830 [marine sediment metagenome]|uniref:Uncharacterized protein n=1 Tax=marine sediment metagenome TaxID=412755 RepID=A0A0F8ZGF8_9ZZZZ